MTTCHAMPRQQYKEAEVDLELALKHCHNEAKSNKRRILNNLVPLRLRLGETAHDTKPVLYFSKLHYYDWRGTRRLLGCKLVTGLPNPYVRDMTGVVACHAN